MSSHPEVGPALRNLREANGLTQEKLGELSGVHSTNIGRIERGEADATLGTLVDLAMALKVEPDYLIRFRMPGGFRLAIQPAPVAISIETLAVHEADRNQAGPARPQFVVVIQQTRNGYSAIIPDLPGCSASGVTREAAEANVLKAGNDHLQGLRRAGRPIPTAHAYAVRMTFDV
ncbi:MAG: helix-turn-helix domain-containing protein [Gemmatimonadales bacterium]|nr:helix-turn-helix domain-containing protein [Gemmatimonadales bacterium]